MKIVGVQSLAIPDVKVIRFARFCDHRGYFTEQFRRSDLDTHPDTTFLRDVPLVQGNESYSKAGAIRGLHFQWNPYMGKLVRTLRGRMVDLVLDIRKGSPTFGRVLAYDMPWAAGDETTEWIWVPPGFAHGNFFPEDTSIEYLCSGEYSPNCEGAVSPLASDLDWSLCDAGLKRAFDDVVEKGAIISDKDRDAPSLEDWRHDDRSENFVYSELS